MGEGVWVVLWGSLYSMKYILTNGKVGSNLTHSTHRIWNCWIYFSYCYRCNTQWAQRKGTRWHNSPLVSMIAQSRSCGVPVRSCFQTSRKGKIDLKEIALNSRNFHIRNWQELESRILIGLLTRTSSVYCIVLLVSSAFALAFYLERTERNHELGGRNWV